MASAGETLIDTQVDPGGGGAGAVGGGGGASGAGLGGGGFFNVEVQGVVRLFGEFANGDLMTELESSSSLHADNFRAMLERVGEQAGFDAVAHEVGNLPPGELEPVGLAGPSGEAKIEALRTAIEEDRDKSSGGESRFRHVLRWGKYFWGSLKNVLGIFFPQLKNLMDAIDELLDYADNALADVEGGWI